MWLLLLMFVHSTIGQGSDPLFNSSTYITLLWVLFFLFVGYSALRELQTKSNTFLRTSFYMITFCIYPVLGMLDRYAKIVTPGHAIQEHFWPIDSYKWPHERMMSLRTQLSDVSSIFNLAIVSATILFISLILCALGNKKRAKTAG